MPLQGTTQHITTEEEMKALLDRIGLLEVCQRGAAVAAEPRQVGDLLAAPGA
jgi:hypothetical protein